ncbi:MAG: peptidoglycan bridge formation glycyltransferase FemA/FemB family protein [Candidatus Dormibacteria bacterium]
MDAGAWDQALAAAPNPHLLQSWRWGDLQARFGWQVERRLLSTADTEVPVSLLTAPTLVPGRRFGYVPRGPAVMAAQMPAMLEATGAWARELGLAFVRAEPELERPWQPPAGWQAVKPTQPADTAILDINRPDDVLLASFKPKTRYNIRLAQKKGVEVQRSEDVAAFARLAGETSTRHQIQLATEPYYRAVMDLMGADGSARLYLASHDGVPLAGIMVVSFGTRATYLFGASTRAGREKMPAYLLHWEAMRELRDGGAADYDLWGTPPDDRPGHPLAGLWQFKSGWQGRMVGYAGAFDLPLSSAAWRGHNALSGIRQQVRKVRSRLAAR